MKITDPVQKTVVEGSAAGRRREVRRRDRSCSSMRIVAHTTGSAQVLKQMFVIVGEVQQEAGRSCGESPPSDVRGAACAWRWQALGSMNIEQISKVMDPLEP